MDLEMTGLDPRKDTIVEIATLVTDDELETVAEGADLVIATPQDALDAMDDVVRQMHARSGLLDAIAISTVMLEQAAKETLEFICQHVPEPRKVPLCGNSIGTDRRFLAAYMPELEELSALPLDRRVDHKRAGQAVVPRGLRRRAEKVRRPPRP